MEKIYGSCGDALSAAKGHFIEVNIFSFLQITQKDKKGEEMRSDFDLTPTVYPPLIFSRVKSYDAVSYQCL